MNDEILILYYYDDGLSERERREVEAALREDPELAARYEKLWRDLGGLGDAEVQAPPPDMVARWHDSIEQAANLERGRRQDTTSGFSISSFGWGVAVTAALAIGIGIGTWFAGTGTVEPTPHSTTASTVGETAPAMSAAFTRGMQAHLRDTHRDIAAMPVDTPEDRTMLVMQIIQQNRMFERAAEQNDAESLARVLRAFEPILLRLAADDIAPEDAEELREQLAFELKVMLTKLERDSSNSTHST